MADCLRPPPNPLTSVQRAILAAIGVREAKYALSAWAIGAFSADDYPIAIRGLPCIPELNGILHDAGFRWSAADKQWVGEDRTAAQVDVLRAIDACRDNTIRIGVAR